MEEKAKNLIELRKIVLERDNYTCQKCGSKEKLECHHIKEKCNYPELKLVVSNCITLCHECHTKTENYKVITHHKKNKTKKDKKMVIRIPNEMALQIEQIAEKIKVSANDVYKFAIYDFIEKHRMF